jgi:hypothetical protein
MDLRPLEKELIASVLPEDRPGYLQYAEDLQGMSVIGQGKRGVGHLVLGSRDARADVDVPLSPVIAFGAFEFQEGQISVAVHAKADNQIHVEIMATPGEDLTAFRTEVRRWTYSRWKPGLPSPQSDNPVREVVISQVNTLAIANTEKRLWLYDSVSGMNQLIPITTFYGELMKVQDIRDPAIALRPARLFEDLPDYSDVTFREAFLSYNKIHPKAEIGQDVPASRHGRVKLLHRFFGRSLRK